MKNLAVILFFTLCCMMSLTAQESYITIKGEEVSQTGIVSAYSSYTFNATSSSGAAITNFSWKYELVDKNGAWLTVQTGINSTLTINPITNDNLYAKSIEGDIKGRISLEANVDGKPKKQILNLNLECKVSDIIVKEIKKIIGDGVFTLILEVQYWGGDYLYMEVEQDNVASINCNTINERNYTIIEYPNLRMGRYIWFDFLAKNKYGTKTYTYEIEPVYDDANSGINDSYPSSSVRIYKVHSLLGVLVGKFDSYSDVLSAGITKGVYIINEIDKDGNVLKKTKINIE